MLARWQPMGDMRGEISRLHNEMNRIFGRYANGAQGLSANTYPPLNIWEDDGALYVEAELPGFDLSDLEMYVTGENQLSIKGKRQPVELENGTWHRQERGFGSFSRVLDLPVLVNSGKVSAEFKNGVLTITLPKREDAKPRRIEVKVK